MADRVEVEIIAIDKVTRTLSNIGAGFTRVGGVLTAAITAPLVGLATKAVMAASDLQEATNAVNVVFGDASGTILQFADDAAFAVGLSAGEFNQLAAITGSFLQNLGFDAAAAADETISLTERASDMASIFNTDVSSALAAIQSGLKGEFNPLEQFGVKINAASIAARALEMGLAETTAELTDNDKAAAALALIYEQTERLAGDFANTSGGLANRTRILKAQFVDMAAQLGEILLPYIEQAVNFIGDLIQQFQGLSPEMQKFILIGAGIAAVIGPALVIIGMVISGIGALLPILAGVASFLLGPWGLAFGLAVAAIIPLINKLGGIKEVAKGVFNIIKLLVTGDFEGGIFGLFEDDPIIERIFALREAVLSFWEFLVTLFTGGEDPVGDFANTFYYLATVFGATREQATSVFLAIRAMADNISDAWNTVIKPALSALWEWLKVAIPQALQTLSVFWNNVLLPAIRNVVAFMVNTFGPVFEKLVEVLRVVIPEALSILKTFWDNTLLPAIQRTWAFIQAHVMPLLAALGSVLGTALRLALTALAGYWQNVLLPALLKVWDFIKTKVIPIFQWLWEKILIPVSDALRNALAPALDFVTGKLKELQTWLSNITLPDWLTPGSPTPFELGLRGINKELGRLTGSKMPALTMGLGGLGEPAFAGAPIGGGASIVINYSPAISFADQSEFNNRIAPLIMQTVGRAIEQSRQ